MATRADLPTKADIEREIRRMGRVFDEDVLKASYALYAPLQERAPKGGIEPHKDIAYGPHERHRLDLFAPARKPAAPAPVVAYFHGGGYVAGARSPLAGLIYDNVATFFARHGMIGVNATYRLAPEHKWPSGAEDVGRVVAWLGANAARFGGDPSRIFVMGQSAGATHVATWTFMERVHGAKGPGVAGAILLSGVYAAQHPDYNTAKPGANQIAYYGEDSANWRDMSPLTHVKAGHPPAYVTVAEYDPYPLAWPSVALASELVKCDKAVSWFRMLAGHNHVSPALQINSEVDDLGRDLLDFVAACGADR